ncbi:hypothetical protein B0J13DRAFT_648543 [Dactylonectria estremocensis]|uniref:Zn(2)-C6 fungal-type domain-containing protein n=1 Tax=Dactylonectria estremocensis TaxID=1079267 RepID=A0A9P9DM24_9HYPO|nr:hypothetical protein B0J13DRAFT_648543 [Dactylonectria estremocensis]
MPPTRRTQRTVTSCTECTRRKTRCSKSIPCSSCIDRGLAQKCHRELVTVVKKSDKAQRSSSSSRKTSTPNGASASDDQIHTRGEDRRSEQLMPGAYEGPASLDNISSISQNKDGIFVSPRVPVDIPTNETVVTLEFLTHGRQNILSLHKGPDDQGPSPANVLGPSADLTTSPSTTCVWDTVLSVHEARLLLELHQERLAWMHNVIHMPSFRQEFESYVTSASCDSSWIALYYAVLCALTFYRATACNASTRALYDKSVQCLFNGNFMAKHTIYSVQAICILMQVAHNIDQSDFICVLIATAIRISQCLNMHRLGPDRQSSFFHDQPKEVVARNLIEREVKKRIWWFLVRQDWLQIPFQNTYLIHASQFNTPLPLNCFDEPELMINDGAVVSQPDHVYTQNSYSHAISKARLRKCILTAPVAVIIWQQQDRMCSIGHPDSSPDGLERIYEQVLRADKELSQVYTDMPHFLKIPHQEPDHQSSCPSYVGLLASISLLSMAHKVLTIHRHFQLQSFHDRRFAYTQSWPENTMTPVVRKTWTVSTHLVTCCIILTFASIFRQNNELLYDASEIHELAVLGRDQIRQLEPSSSIARRGGILVDLLLQIAESSDGTKNMRLDLSDIVRRVSRVHDDLNDGMLQEAEQFVLQCGTDAWDGLFGMVDLDGLDA